MYVKIIHCKKKLLIFQTNCQNQLLKTFNKTAFKIYLKLFSINYLPKISIKKPFNLPII